MSPPVPRGAWARGGKRAADAALVLAAAPLWVPLTAVLAGAVLLASGRPAFFAQPRVGRHGRVFTLLKLRTMSPRAAPPQGARFASWTYAGDPRVTRIGRWLRRWRLDELPQLANVLAGQMSLVGPRPETPEVVAGLRERLPDYDHRSAVRPGLTGVCQVSDAYARFATWDEVARKLELDLGYVAAVSLRTDARVLARTLGVLARGQGVI
ncbi:MAG TPA: sugar transferase [Longimicrobiaceae bacterium]|nr:sugar transferase [Longimicrobiaceae bacterium]